LTAADDDVPARFCIHVTLEDGEAVITNLLDVAGAETADPRKAVAAVAQLITGPDVGSWVTFSINPDDFVMVKKH